MKIDRDERRRGEERRGKFVCGGGRRSLAVFGLSYNRTTEIDAKSSVFGTFVQ
jgi:hypothetical protein